MSRVPHFDAIVFLVILVLAIVLFVASLSWAWVGETVAAVSLLFLVVRRLGQRRRAA
jgi:hypothetical protein